MKKILPLLCLFLTLSSYSLLAQEKSSPITPSLPEAPHVGMSNVYPIGSPENRVTANEYCAFLNLKATKCYHDNYRDLLALKHPNNYYNLFASTALKSSTGDEHSLEPSQPLKTVDTQKYPDYFDSVLMDPSSEQHCIVRQALQNTFHMPEHCTGISISAPSYSNTSWCYSYFVEEGKGDVIIDSLTEEYAQKDFNAWRENPTMQELCNYLNNKLKNLKAEGSQDEIASRENYCLTLVDHYPSSNALFDQADRIAQEMVASDIKLQPNHIQATDCEGALSFGWNGHVTVSGGTEYHRTSSIIRSYW